jgi:hypothetical protein
MICNGLLVFFSEFLQHRYLLHFRVQSNLPMYVTYIKQVPLVEQKLLTLPDHLNSPPVFSGVRVTWSLVLYVCFVDRFVLCTFSFGHCVVCSSIYRFWLPLWYLQTQQSSVLKGQISYKLSLYLWGLTPVL